MLRGSIRALQTAGASKRCYSQVAQTTRATLKPAVGRRPLAVSQQRRHESALHSPPDPNDNFLSGSAANYIDEMYLQWKQDPKSVHVSWQVYFKNMESGNMPISQAFQPPPSLVPGAANVVPAIAAGAGVGIGEGANVTNHLKVQLLVRAYQARGHHKANIDPLGIRNTPASKGFGNIRPKELTPEYYGFTEKDLDTEYSLGPGILPRFARDGREKMTLREIIDACEKIYCGSYGVEFIHIPDREKCDWLRERLEIPQPFKYSIDEKRRILDRLIWSSSFESFLATKYPNDKRFGLEGCETLVPGMKALIDRSVDYGVKDIVIGMPHRGRLNVLSNVVRKPNEAIFSEFAGMAGADEEGSGDVKYHLGMNFERPTPSGKRVQLSLVANPSHLEAEDPVVLGKVRAIQHYNNDESDHKSAMGVLLHGDAAIAGQGIVYECLGFHNLPAFSTGGTIHLVVNNQIGFTTDPRFARSTAYCTDIAKAIDAPVFHVNADDVEAVNFVCQLASDWRAEFKQDVIIDLVCYRKHGHNETDQPAFTQPLMYKRISEKSPQIDIYVDQLLKEGTFTKEDIEEHKQWVWGMLEESFSKSKDYQPTSKEWTTSAWNNFKSPKELASEVLPHMPTAVDKPTLEHIGTVIGSTPEGFHAHRNLKRILTNRTKSVVEGKGIDWATAEALAFGTLVKEGHHVRITGQDVERGTFSQRHAVFHDQETEDTYIPLQHISEDQAPFVISNSSLSEYGILGFEYGYSLQDPNGFNMWEAQFGDFANTAQVIIDQFLASGESKWMQRTGLVMSLPHGYDGQGPEHSSARMERFLSLCNEDPRIYPSPEKLERQHQDCNMQIAYMTSPANLFHILRRQLKRQFRKPLVIFFSKALLRHPVARSDIEEFTDDAHFRWILPDSAHQTGEIKAPEEIERVILCTGQVYAALLKHRQDNKIDNVAFTRIEQLHPFPWEQLRENLDQYPNAKTIVWAQEEPLNAGAWSYTQPRLETLLNHTKHHDRKHVMYAGRAPSASVATGKKSSHLKEEKELLEMAFSVTQSKLKGE
ncbi:2-oxoglutarate dehydrogenase E1 component mitochondrial precursor [Neurospora tetrasperma FGSC 2508]|uniref:2-oxoglutarate dehydrogenase, mitochondrial n=1 Tax=Neurospora tetrasperma (strain FGSC 2508 / ATCC MYA-4615 / P0657) TaxID=510951 RepID=F8MR23_NEUT8|nr:2-oxoglutarate dehydrogenase E1 component mitochondrial precursor [Neurospora tetrasperma FGSC 2508]EGO56803.1 2-oxoglutarate dehydrogenase E1 component mitochondrial precursor [Neurospora tetrasperma FGSC 2508]EGZ70307.1 2-oxoglutarate dehydrogenase E1 component mitochondrial precursor [Neurospora tetrasperma FGSC 2509]